MTRTDAINILKNEKPHCGRKIRYTEGDICEAFDMAINSLLEKEDADEFIPKSVIEDIKAEIYKVMDEPQYQHEDEDWDVGLAWALEIIDKHISRKENNVT